MAYRAPPSRNRETRGGFDRSASRGYDDAMLAISTMSPELQALFFGAAVVCFVLTALSFGIGKLVLEPLGLALFVFVFFWNALAQA